MKKCVYNLYWSCGALVFSVMLGTGSAMAVTSGCIPGDCTGYEKTAAECSGKTAIKCPFDTSKFYCGEDEPGCTSVNVGEYDVCTKYCETDSKVCTEKRALSCVEYVSKKNGRLVDSGELPVTSGTITNDLYLIGEVRGYGNENYEPLVLDTIQVFDAADVYKECKDEANYIPASLTITKNLNLKNSVFFHVPVNLNIDHDESAQKPFRATFGRDSSVLINLWGALAEIAHPSLEFIGYDSVGSEEQGETHHKVKLSCGPYRYNAGSEKTSYCGVNIEFSDAYVDLCKTMDECNKYSMRWCSWRDECTGGREDSNGQWQDNLTCDYTGEACQL